MRREPVWFGLALAAGVVMVAPVSGWWQPVFAARSDVTLGGVVLGSITQSADRYTAAQRIVFVRKRITNVLSDRRFQRAPHLFVHAGAGGANATVSVGTLSVGPAFLVVTHTSQDARANHATVNRLASRWATNLSKGLSKAMPTAYVKKQ